MSQPLVIFLILMIVAIVLAMAGTLLTLNRKDQEKKALSVIMGQKAFQALENPEDLKNKRRAELAKKLQDGGDPSKAKKDGGLKNNLLQAGLEKVSVKQFWLSSVALGLVLALLVKLSGQPMIVVALVAIIGVFGIPRLFLRIKRQRRQKKFLDDFADALESMVRLLKAGMPVGEAIAMVSREFTGPVGEEMAKVYDEQKIGIPLAEACLKAAERMPIPEMQMFATGISIQQQTGSSLSEILTNLSRVIRARFRLKRKVQALSAEAKASAGIVGSLPIVVAGGLYLINPDYMEPLFYTVKGKMYLGGAICWMSMGILVMKQMINFKV
jgi:tight adherence protein B